jgi:four helix bundle protein
VTYRSLEVWQLARDLSVDIHKLTLERLPGIERFEEGQQIRRSIKSVRSNIVEGYGRRRYKQEFIRFLTYAFASALEAVDHLECLSETGSLENEAIYTSLHSRLEELGRKLNNLIQAVESGHQSVRDGTADYRVGEAACSSTIHYPTSTIPESAIPDDDPSNDPGSR